MQIKRTLSLAIITCMAKLALAQPQANKPNTQTQVPGPSQTVHSVPGAYSSGVMFNYIKSREAMGAITDSSSFRTATYTDVKEATQYVDGLGRPLQSVSRQVTPSAKDLVAPVVYDAFGREIYKYLPYVQTDSNTNDGSFKTNPFSRQASFYSNSTLNPGLTGEQVYYGQTIYEASSLNRVLKTLAPGNSWAGSNVGDTLQYLVNKTADSVRIWTITNDTLTYESDDYATNIPATSSSYGAAQLYKNVTIDEHGNTVVEYKDKEGQVILKKVQVGTIASDFSGYSGFLCTYYVYDDMNRLRFVMQPKAVKKLITSSWTFNDSTINELCFRYEYDGRKRMIAKKVPGAGWVYMVYDQRDRLVFSQDAIMRSNNQWMTTIYDPLNRP